MSPERFARITDMINRRQTDLTVCLEVVHKPHNLAAIVRTADAVGIHNVHAVWPSDNPRVARGTAAGSHSWVGVNRHETTQACVDAIKAQGMQILVTNLCETAVDYRELDYTKPTAIMVGQEKHGISEQALALADAQVYIPMVGMVQSLNVSVAAALLLYEAQRQRQAAGMYDRPSVIPHKEQEKIYFEGGHPIFAKLCRQKNLPYPNIGEQGQIIAPDEWWQKIQMSDQALAQMLAAEAAAKFD